MTRRRRRGEVVYRIVRVLWWMVLLLCVGLLAGLWLLGLPGGRSALWLGGLVVLLFGARIWARHYLEVLRSAERAVKEIEAEGRAWVEGRAPEDTTDEDAR